MRTATFFAERRDSADLDALRTILTREGGEQPILGDETFLLNVAPMLALIIMGH